MVREAEASGVYRIEQAIDMTASGEVYHGHYTLPTAQNGKPHWSIVHTLYVGDLVAGMISVSGNVNACGSPYLHKVEKLVRMVESRLVAEDAPVIVPEPAPFPIVNLSVN